MTTSIFNDHRALLESITQKLPLGAFIFDLQSIKVLWSNDRAKALFGNPFHEIKIHPEDLPIFQSTTKTALNLKDGETLSLEYRVQSFEREFIQISSKIVCFSRAENGNVATILSTFTEAREILPLQNNRREEDIKTLASIKMAALEEMAANLAHEINNPLTIIQGRSYQLLQLAEAGKLNPGKLKQIVESISHTSDKISSIIESLRAQTHDGTSDNFEVVTVEKIIKQTLDFCKARFMNHGVSLQVNAFPEDLEVECRVVQIQQVLLNLLKNSFTAVKTQDDKWVRIQVEEFDEAIEISVLDSGPGIPENQREQINTRKHPGLGLNLSTWILSAHNGSLIIKTDQPHTTVTIHLPRLQSHA